VDHLRRGFAIGGKSFFTHRCGFATKIGLWPAVKMVIKELA